MLAPPVAAEAATTDPVETTPPVATGTTAVVSSGPAVDPLPLAISQTADAYHGYFRTLLGTVEKIIELRTDPDPHITVASIFSSAAVTVVVGEDRSSLDALADSSVRIIIDNASKTMDAQVATFNRYFRLLRPGGSYVFGSLDPVYRAVQYKAYRNMLACYVVNELTASSLVVRKTFKMSNARVTFTPLCIPELVPEPPPPPPPVKPVPKTAVVPCATPTEAVPSWYVKLREKMKYGWWWITHMPIPLLLSLFGPLRRRYFGVDRVFYINLDRSTDRREYVEQHLRERGLWAIAERVPGVVWTLPVPDWFGSYWKRGRRRRLGEFGCVLAHLACYERAFCRRYNSVLIVEDDVVLHGKAINLLRTLPKKFSLAYLGYQHGVMAKTDTMVWSTLFNVHPGFFAYCVNHSILPTLLKYADPRIHWDRSIAHNEEFGGGIRVGSGVADTMVPWLAVTSGIPLYLSVPGAALVRANVQSVIYNASTVHVCNVSPPNVTPPRKPCLWLHSIDFTITDRCILRCAACSTNSPCNTSSVYVRTVSEFERDLSHVRDVLRVGNIAILGGEPLLRKDIDTIIKLVRQSGIANSISVTTNGLLLPDMAHKLKEADSVHVSVYPSVARQRFLDEWIKTQRILPKEKISLRLPELKGNKFRALLTDTPADDEVTMTRFRNCYAFGFCKGLTYGRIYPCPIMALHMRKARHASLFPDESVSIYADNLLDTLYHEFNRRSTTRMQPFAACRYCVLLDTSLASPHRELTIEELRKLKNDLKQEHHT